MEHTTPQATDRFITAKELACQLRDAGVRPSSYEAALAVIDQCPAAVGRTIRFDDALQFLRGRGRDFHPCAKSTKKPDKSGQNRKIAEKAGIVVLE